MSIKTVGIKSLHEVTVVKVRVIAAKLNLVLLINGAGMTYYCQLKVNVAGMTYYCQLKVNAARHNLATVKAKFVNGEGQLQALVNEKKILITESTIRRDLQLEDAEGVDCLPNAVIFELFTLIGKPRRKVTEVPQPHNPSEHVAGEAVNVEMDDSLERVATTATSLDAEHVRGNIFKTQSKVTYNEPGSQETSSGGGPRCQKSMGDTVAQTRSERVSKISNDPLLAGVNTPQNDHSSSEIDNLKRRVKKLERRKRMILESVENAPLIWPSIEENGVTRPKKDSELSATEAIQADYDVKATNIILQGLPPEVYALVSNHKVAKELWERIQLLMQGTSLTKQDREYDETSKDKEIDKLMALISLLFKKIYKPTNNNLRTLSNTSRANQDNSPRINRNVRYENQRIGNVAGAREIVGSSVVQKSGIQCYNCKEFRKALS
nr:retrovirus-related Pol polyprotein from transposon TNT 1-94 [Tanacetum cinerariifolium]